MFVDLYTGEVLAGADVAERACDERSCDDGRFVPVGDVAGAMLLAAEVVRGLIATAGLHGERVRVERFGRLEDELRGLADVYGRDDV